MKARLDIDVVLGVGFPRCTFCVVQHQLAKAQVCTLLADIEQLTEPELVVMASVVCRVSMRSLMPWTWLDPEDFALLKIEGQSSNHPSQSGASDFSISMSMTLSSLVLA